MMWIQSFKHSGNAIYATLPSCACLINQSPIEGAGHLSQASNEYQNLGHAVVDKLYGGVLSCSCCGNADPKVYSTAAPPPPCQCPPYLSYEVGFQGHLEVLRPKERAKRRAPDSHICHTSGYCMCRCHFQPCQ